MTTAASGAASAASGGGNGRGRGGRGRDRADIIEVGQLFEKPPPQAPMAEAALLGAMLLDPRIIHEIIPVIRTGDTFHDPVNGTIYEAIVRVYDQRQTVNMVLLAEHLEQKQSLATIGGPEYLLRLVEGTPGPATAVHFAKIVVAKAKLRNLIEVGGQMVYDAYHASDLGPENVREIIDAAEARIFQIADSEESGEAEHLSVLVERELERLEALQGKAISGVPTGFRDLDALTSGLQQGELIILAARPSMGKTALALNLAEQIAVGGAPSASREARAAAPVGIFSLEMSKASIAQRMLSARSGYSTHDMRSGRLRDEDYDRLHESLEELKAAPIYIDDTPSLTALGLRTRARRMVSQHGVKCIFIDYLQLMTAPNAAKESRQVEVSAISRAVKALARELSVPVVCLSQLNRGPESRGDNRPRMSDLRESGSIEQDADVIILIHREAYYHVGDRDWEAENPDKLNKTELIIAKQRNGPTDVVELVWDQKITRFKDAARYGGGGDYGGGSGYSAAPAAPKPRPGGGAAGAAGGGWSPAGDPFRVPVTSFQPGKKTGPVEGFRDGGGPDKDEAPPFATGDEDDDGGLPV